MTNTAALRPACESYRIFHIKGRQILAVPAGVSKRLRLAGIARYQPVTARRAGVRLLMQLATATGMDRLLCHHSANPINSFPDFNFNEWLAHVQAELKAPATVAILVWPPQKYRERTYVHLLDPAGTPRGFAKISFNEDKARLLNEVDTLNKIVEHIPPTIRVPKILATGDFNGAYHAVFEPLPVQSRPFNGPYNEIRSIIDDFADSETCIDMRQLERLVWWQRFIGADEKLFYAFACQLNSLLDGYVSVRRVHGDFSPSNLCRSGERIWIFDWENSCERGPVLTDEVSYYLASTSRRIFTNPRVAGAKVVERFIELPSTSRRLDVMLALVYLHVSGRREASLGMLHWPPIKGEVR